MQDPQIYQLMAIIFGYAAGSIPFGFLLTHSAGLGDIREVGSKNIGATNVLRTGNKFLALLTFLGDSGKGVVAALSATMLWGSDCGLIAGFMAVVGHNFPIWLDFKGGKGFATTLGVLLYACWPAGIAACIAWLVVAGTSRYSSLASIVALLIAPAFAFWMGAVPQGLMTGGLTLLGLTRHHENIRRLRSGEEVKIGCKDATMSYDQPEKK